MFKPQLQTWILFHPCSGSNKTQQVEPCAFVEPEHVRGGARLSLLLLSDKYCFGGFKSLDMEE